MSYGARAASRSRSDHQHQLICNVLGMDTISAGSTRACAMELTERACWTAPADWPGGPAGADGRGHGYPRAGRRTGQRQRPLAAKYGAPDQSMSVRSWRGPPTIRAGCRPGPAVRHQQPGRLPQARHHALLGIARPAEADRPPAGAGQSGLLDPSPAQRRRSSTRSWRQVRQRFAMPRKTSPVALTALTGVSNPTGD